MSKVLLPIALLFGLFSNYTITPVSTLLLANRLQLHKPIKPKLLTSPALLQELPQCYATFLRLTGRVCTVSTVSLTVPGWCTLCTLFTPSCLSLFSMNLLCECCSLAMSTRQRSMLARTLEVSTSTHRPFHLRVMNLSNL